MDEFTSRRIKQLDEEAAHLRRSADEIEHLARSHGIYMPWHDRMLTNQRESADGVEAVAGRLREQAESGVDGG